MALQPSRPGFMLAGALVFLALPFLWAGLAHEPVSGRHVILGIAVALLFVTLAAQYRRQARDARRAPPLA